MIHIKQINYVLQNNLYYPLYLGFHGDNPENFNNLKDITNKAITYVPSNLCIIHIFKHGQCGYSDNEDEKKK